MTWSKPLLRELRSRFECDWDGYHGIRHWYNVALNARYLHSRMPSADRLVTDLFALFHDVGRVNENDDPGHGIRGAFIAEELRGKFFDCTDKQMSQLVYACTNHTLEIPTSDPVVATCWAADRLDLTRVGISVEFERLPLMEGMMFNGYIVGEAHRRSTQLTKRIRSMLPPAEN